MLELLPEDIHHRIKNDFGKDAPFVLELLTNYHAYFCTKYRHPDSFGDRLIRCAIQCAQGSLSGLQHALDTGVSDYRDLIVSGEYDHEYNQIRHLTKPFEAT